MPLFFKKIYKFKKNLIKYLVGLLCYYLKFQITVLNIIVKNPLLYFIYISLIIYSHFGCIGNVQCNQIHYVTFFIILYLQTHCIEIYFFCKFSKSRNWLIKLVGTEYFASNFPNKNTLLLKYFLPVFFLLILEGLSTYLIFYYDLGLQDVYLEAYKKLYGNDMFYWPLEAKEKFLKEQLNVMSSASNTGAICYIAKKMTFLIDHIIKIVKTFV